MTSSARDEDAAADDRSAARRRPSGRDRARAGPGGPSGREPDRRRLDRPGDPEHRSSATGAAAERPRPARPSSPPSSGRRREEGQPRVREHLREQPRGREEEQRRLAAARRARGAGRAPSSARAPAVRAGRPPSRAGRGAVGDRASRRARARSAASAATSSSGHHFVQDRREHGRDQQRQERRRQPRLDPASQGVGHAHPSREAARGELHPDERVGGREGPLAGHAGERERAVASVSAGTVESSASTIQRSSVSSPCSSTSRAQQRIVRKPAPEAGGADDLLGAVDLGATRKRPSRAAALDRLVPGSAGRVRGRAEARAGAPLAGPRRGAEAREPALREERPRRR